MNKKNEKVSTDNFEYLLKMETSYQTNVPQKIKKDSSNSEPDSGQKKPFVS